MKAGCVIIKIKIELIPIAYVVKYTTQRIIAKPGEDLDAELLGNK